MICTLKINRQYSFSGSKSTDVILESTTIPVIYFHRRDCLKWINASCAHDRYCCWRGMFRLWMSRWSRTDSVSSGTGNSSTKLFNSHKNGAGGWEMIIWSNPIPVSFILILLFLIIFYSINFAIMPILKLMYY